MITVTPADCLFTDPVAMRVSGLKPGGAAILRLTHHDAAGVRWVSEGQFRADAAGDIDPASAPSSGGTYTGTDGDGLWWSMRPEGHDDLQAFQQGSSDVSHNMGQPAGDPFLPREYRLEAIVDGAIVATHPIVRRRLDDRVTMETVNEGRLRGVAFSRGERMTSRGAILVVTGSGGGIDTSYAPLLASAGYDVFAIAYFHWEDRPATIDRIDLEYFEEAMHWMIRRFGHSRVAVQGPSRGGELALLLGATFPDLVAGVTGFVPNSHVFAGWNDDEGWNVPAWTYRGEPVPHLGLGADEDLTDVIRMTEGGVSWAPVYDHALRPDDPGYAMIEVERTSGPILLISAAEDAMWPCTPASDRVVDRLRMQGFAHPWRHLRLEGVGHVTPPPHSVTSMARSIWHPLVAALADCGGQPKATAAAGWTIWQALLDHYAAVFARR